MLEGCKRLYKCYYRIKGKCYNNKDDHYKYYGGRGIKCVMNGSTIFKHSMIGL